MKKFILIGLLLILSQTIFANTNMLDRFYLQQAIYFESRGEPLIGQVAVGLVIRNRVESKLFPNTYQNVVLQGTRWATKRTRTGGCEFSYQCDGKEETVSDGKAWAIAGWVADTILSHRVPDFLEGATHFEMKSNEPYWAKEMRIVVQISNHIFYKK